MWVMVIMWWQFLFALLLFHPEGIGAKHAREEKNEDRSLAADDYFEDPDEPLLPPPNKPDFPQPNLPIQLEPEQGNACHQQCGDKFSSALKAAFQAPNHYERFEQVCHHFNETLHCMAQLNLCSDQESFDVMTSGLYYMCVEQKKAFEAVIECVDAQADAVQKECDATCQTKTKMANWAVQSGMIDRFLGKSVFAKAGRADFSPPLTGRRMGGIFPNDDFTPLALRLPPDLNSEESRREAVASGKGGVSGGGLEKDKAQPPQPIGEEEGFSKTSSKRWKNKKSMQPVAVETLDPAASPPSDKAEPAPNQRDVHIGDVVEEPFEAAAAESPAQVPLSPPVAVQMPAGIGAQNPQFLRTLIQDGCELTHCHLGCMRTKFDARCGRKAGTLLSEAFVRPIGESQKLLGVGAMSSVLHAFVPQQCDFMMNEQALQKFRIDPKEDAELRAMYSGADSGLNNTSSTMEPPVSDSALTELENTTGNGVVSADNSTTTTDSTLAESNSTAAAALTPAPPLVDVDGKVVESAGGVVVGNSRRAQPPAPAADFYYQPFRQDQTGR